MLWHAGNATVRFSDEASNENPYSNGTPPSRKMPRTPSAQHYPSSRWRSNFLTSSTSPMDLSADSTARTDTSTESAPSQQAVLGSVLPDEASPGSSIGSESDSDAESESGSEYESESGSGSETSSNAPGPASTAGQVSTSDAASAVGLQTSSHAVAALYSSAGNSLEAGAPVSSSGQQSQQTHQAQQTQQAQQAIAGLADRCLRPLSKLQQADFLPSGGRRSSYSRQSSQIAGMVAGGSRSNNTSRQSTGLVWQNSGWTVAFDPSLVQRQQAGPALPAVPLEQQSKLTTSLSWHATSLDDVERVSTTADAALQSGAAGAAAGVISNQLAGTVATAGTAGPACAADTAGAMTRDELLDPNDSAPQRGIHTGQQQDLQQHSLVQLANTGETHHSGQDEPQQPAEHAKHGSSKKRGSRIRKHSRHGEDAALAHIEDHLQVLKHVHLKKASPR